MTAKTATICAAVFSLAPIVVSADKTINGEVQLSGHTDWTGEGTVTLSEGATIDLTAWPSSIGWPVASSFTTGSHTLAFESGTAASHSTMTVKIDGGRSDVRAFARAKGYLLNWNAKPENVDFALDSGDDAMYRIEADAIGLMLYRAPGMMIVVR